MFVRGHHQSSQPLPPASEGGISRPFLASSALALRRSPALLRSPIARSGRLPLRRSPIARLRRSPRSPPLRAPAVTRLAQSRSLRYHSPAPKPRSQSAYVYTLPAGRFTASPNPRKCSVGNRASGTPWCGFAYPGSPSGGHPAKRTSGPRTRSRHHHSPREDTGVPEFHRAGSLDRTYVCGQHHRRLRRRFFPVPVGVVGVLPGTEAQPIGTRMPRR